MSECQANSSSECQKRDDTEGQEEIQLSYWDKKLQDINESEDLSHLSKNQRKKLLKKKMFMETRLERRKEEREKKKIKRAEKKEAGLPLPESRQVKKRRKRECSNFKVAIDLDFYDLMNDRDLRMVLKQVKSCYSENRRGEHPLQLSVTSFNNELKGLWLEIQPGIANWDLRMEAGKYSETFEQDKIVYLTSDSENVLETLEEDKVYIIGGLVDHNHHKGLCYKRARDSGIAHAQLPIGQYVKMNSRKVLTINHVFEILLAYSESKDWKEAFFKVLPSRKGISEVEVSSETKGGHNSAEEEKCEAEELDEDESLINDVPAESSGGASQSDSRGQEAANEIQHN